MSVQNWHDEFDKFWLEHSKISKNGTEKWCKMWKKTDLCFQKRDEWFGKFSPGHSKVSKSGSYCIMIMNNDFFYGLKNSDFIVESKMAELN